VIAEDLLCVPAFGPQVSTAGLLVIQEFLGSIDIIRL
jgi:hypothetical protein